MFVWACPASMCAGRDPILISGIVLHCSPAYTLSQGLSAEPRAPWSGYSGLSACPRKPLSLLPEHLNYGWLQVHLAFTWVPGTRAPVGASLYMCIRSARSTRLYLSPAFLMVVMTGFQPHQQKVTFSWQRAKSLRKSSREMWKTIDL